MGHNKFLYLMLLLGEAFLMINCQGPPLKGAEQSGGSTIDVESIVEDINRGKPTDGRRRVAERTLFAEADQDVKTNEAEHNFRNMYNHSPGNEYVDVTDISQSSQDDTDALRTVVDRTGIDISQSFDSDGKPTDARVQEVSFALMYHNPYNQEENVPSDGFSFNRGPRIPRDPTCAYHQAQSKPCSDGFREPTARCTNLEKGRRTWGMAGTPYTRTLPPAYEDGISERQKTEFFSGNPLPSPREISTTTTATSTEDLDFILNNDGFNTQIFQWGQFTAHEFTHIAEAKADIACCPDQIFAARNGPDVEPTPQQLEKIREEVEEFRGDVCMQIETANDTKFGGYLCMSQTRTLPAPTHECILGPRQQMNAITHVFDGSAIYGSSQVAQDKLRAATGGRLKTQTVNGRELPPENTEDCVEEKKLVNRCPFMGGDTRINTTPNLAATHTVFVVHHNRLADNLSTINPHWDNERLFQETRRIISGIESSIQYYEYLPIIIGAEMMKKYQIDQYRGYDPEVNPSSLSELAHVAYRFGHSALNGIFAVQRDNGEQEVFNLREHFSKSELVYEDGFRQFLIGLAAVRPWMVDHSYTDAMRDFMFDKRNDIVSLNINRGRDHGFRPYVEYRRHYGLSVPLTFDDLRATHRNITVDALSKLYSSVADVELYMAGITEKTMPGAIVGELFAHMIGDGFLRIQRGDRMFFESRDNGLTPAQIEAIKGYKYTQLLCEAGGLDRVSSNAFVMPGRMDATEIDCASLPPFDLTLWREEPAPACHWEIRRKGLCCHGKRTVRRRCVGERDCTCQGNANVEEVCN